MKGQTDKGAPMKKAVGLWIDHKKAVIVSDIKAGGEVVTIESNMEKHVRYKEGARPKTAYGAQHSPAEDVQDRKYNEHLNKYYNKIIAQIRKADSILIMGPGEAKHELEKRLAHEELTRRIVGIETVDKMTDRQIAAKVRKYFT
jgi:stalled ribosome rescue protein Dom34